eukprot:3166116-Amphidinium_carterae.1
MSKRKDGASTGMRRSVSKPYVCANKCRPWAPPLPSDSITKGRRVSMNAWRSPEGCTCKY